MAAVVLYQFPGAYGLVSLSPFCTKLEAYLRLAEIPYESKLGDPRRAPKGKLPCVRIEGELVGDSSLIIDRLRDVHGERLDEALEPAEHARGHLAQRCAEDHLYWGLLHVRWDDDVCWNGGYRDVIAGLMPAPVRPFVPWLLRRGVRKSLRAHGLGRHTRDEIASTCARDLDAFAGLLDGGDFLLGDRPTRYDCAVFAMLEHLRRTPTEHPLARALRERSTLLRYCERMNGRLGWDHDAVSSPRPEQTPRGL